MVAMEKPVAEKPADEKPSDDMATFKAKIEKLNVMKNSGIISEEEFNNIKTKLLSEIL